MDGYKIIREVSNMFLNQGRGWDYYSRYTEIDGEELCLEDEVLARFEESDLVTQYSYQTEYFDGGPGYEATVIFFAWTDNIGTLHTDSVLTECM